MAYRVKKQNKTYWVLNSADMRALSSIGHAPPFTDEELSHAPVWVTAMLDDLADLQ